MNDKTQKTSVPIASAGKERNKSPANSRKKIKKKRWQSFKN